MIWDESTCHSLYVDRQERIDQGELIRWTKGFGAPNTEGRDVAEMFRQSLRKYVRLISGHAITHSYATLKATPGAVDSIDQRHNGDSYRISLR